jgi:hypothetical protein
MAHSPLIPSHHLLGVKEMESLLSLFLLSQPAFSPKHYRPGTSSSGLKGAKICNIGVVMEKHAIPSGAR